MPGKECLARLIIETRHARPLYSAVEPDNRRVPSHVRVSCRPGDNVLECTARVEGCEDPRRVLTLRNTVDDLLIDVRSALEALNLAE